MQAALYMALFFQADAQEAVRNMDATSWKVRESATKRAAAMGARALPTLYYSVYFGPSLEVRNRCKQAVNAFHLNNLRYWSVFPTNFPMGKYPRIQFLPAEFPDFDNVKRAYLRQADFGRTPSLATARSCWPAWSPPATSRWSASSCSGTSTPAAAVWTWTWSFWTSAPVTLPSSSRLTSRQAPPARCSTRRVGCSSWPRARSGSVEITVRTDYGRSVDHYSYTKAAPLPVPSVPANARAHGLRTAKGLTWLYGVSERTVRRDASLGFFFCANLFGFLLRRVP